MVDLLASAAMSFFEGQQPTGWILPAGSESTLRAYHTQIERLRQQIEQLDHLRIRAGRHGLSTFNFAPSLAELKSRFERQIKAQRAARIPLRWMAIGFHAEIALQGSLCETWRPEEMTLQVSGIDPRTVPIVYRKGAKPAAVFFLPMDHLILGSLRDRLRLPDGDDIQLFVHSSSGTARRYDHPGEVPAH